MNRYLLPMGFCAASLVSTLLGGLGAFRLRKRMHLLMGLAAGVMLGLVTFDILPEIMTRVRDLGVSARGPMMAFAAGYLIFHVLERAIAIHHGEGYCDAGHRHPQAGILSAVALIGHSMTDGICLGLAFQVSHAIGITVGVAVISHDAIDGMNTVAVMLNSENSDRRAAALLVVDALAPIAGVILTFFIQPSPQTLTIFLGYFAGFILYIGGAYLLSEAHSEQSTAGTVVATVLGTAAAFAVSALG
ncbi:MAG: ZIP family metal transporter [Elusimicrobia bacterium]|nr:ZIP family metal transporter [Elusimicrobiota bacterium]